MVAPVLVPCLVALRSEFNRQYPNRDKGADGWIGDAAHQAESSDHNPDETGRTPSGDTDNVDEVHAVDIDRDLTGTDAGYRLNLHVEHIRKEHLAGRDNRLQNIIWRGRIASRSWGWNWHNYTGASKHFDHAHFSARYTTAQESDTSSWGVFREVSSMVDITPSDANGNAVLARSIVPKDGGAAGDKVTALEALRQAQVSKNRITELCTGVTGTVPPHMNGDGRSLYTRLDALEDAIATLTATVGNMAAIVTKLDLDPADEPPQENPIVLGTRWAIAHPS